MTYVIGRLDLAIGLTLLGLIITAGGILFNWIMSRSTNRLIKSMHTDTQQTLGGINQTLGGINQTLANMGQILERMDQRAEERYRDLRGRIDGEV